jgi:hypothetical protein
MARDMWVVRSRDAEGVHFVAEWFSDSGYRRTEFVADARVFHVKEGAEIVALDLEGRRLGQDFEVVRVLWTFVEVEPWRRNRNCA